MTSINPFKVFEVLKQRHIALLWLGQLLSAFGDRFFEIAVVWLSVQIVGSEAGFVLAAGSIARLIVGLFGGVYADRWDRQKTMVVVDVLRMLALLSLPIAAVLGDITLVHLMIIAVIEQGLSGLFDPALQASMPVLAPDSKTLQASNALLDVTSRMARIVAPGLAGLLVAVLPISQFFTLDAMTFGISALALVAIGRGFKWQPEVVDSDTKGLQSIFSDLSGAVKLVYQNKAVFWSMLSYIPANITWGSIFMVGLALYSDDVVNRGVQGYSFMIAAYGTGSVISNLIVGSMTIKNRARFLFVGVIVFSLGFFLIGFTDSYWLALVCMFVAACGTPMSDLIMLLMIQEEFPQNQVGKVFSLRLTISSAGYSLGLLFAASLFKWVSVQQGIAVLASITLITGVVGLWRFSGRKIS